MLEGDLVAASPEGQERRCMAQSNRQGERSWERGKDTEVRDGEMQTGVGRRRLSKTGKEMQRPRG